MNLLQYLAFTHHMQCHYQLLGVKTVAIRYANDDTLDVYVRVESHQYGTGSFFIDKDGAVS